MAALMLFAGLSGAAGEDEPAGLTGGEICGLIESEAEARALPPGFFARLIWQESRFNRLAVSPKGAQGIAQFMPGTAAERDLQDPFDIPSALAASAAFLAELSGTFGNLGLAAAAYNAGPERVRRWLADESGLPRETRHFVAIITGLAADHWRSDEIARELAAADYTLDEGTTFAEACEKMAARGLLAAPAVAVQEAEEMLPWGAQVAAHFSREVALTTFDRLQRRFDAVLGGKSPLVVRHRAAGRGARPLYAVRLGAETREGAEALCAELRAAAGNCMVMKN